MKLKLSIILLLIFSISFLAHTQLINLRTPQGTYYLTDKTGKDYKLVLKPIIKERSTSYYNCGKAELSRLGDNPETFYGNWKVNTKYNASPAELNYVEIEISEGTDLYLNRNYGSSRFNISKDGWVYPDMFQCMDENPKYRVKISKSPTR